MNCLVHALDAHNQRQVLDNLRRSQLSDPGLQQSQVRAGGGQQAPAQRGGLVRAGAQSSAAGPAHPGGRPQQVPP
jgi:hypothetical protein